MSFLTYIDWSTVANVVTAIAVAVGAVVAILGLRTWCRELRGKEDHDLAKRIITATYSVRDRFSWLRSKNIFGAELLQESETDTALVGLTRDALEGRARRAYEERWRELVEAIATLYTALSEAEVLWETAYVNHKPSLAGVKEETEFRLCEFLAARSDSGTNATDARSQFFGSAEDDSLGSRVRSCLEDIEADARKKLAR